MLIDYIWGPFCTPTACMYAVLGKKFAFINSMFSSLGPAQARPVHNNKEPNLKLNYMYV